MGIRVEAKIALIRKTADRWMELARQWQLATRAGALAFTGRPEPMEGSRNRTEPPDPAEVAAFLAAVFESREFDLWYTDPFATLLRALCSGVDTIPRCGTPNVAGVSQGKLVIGCRSGSLECSRTHRSPCDCEYALLCDVIDPICEADPPVTGNVDGRGWDRMFCRALQVLVPRFLEELVLAARYEQHLQNRRAGERFRVAARHGKVRVWSDKGGTNRDRTGGDNDEDGKHDLA